MNAGRHLWAIAYNDMAGAEQLRAELTSLGERQCLVLLDSAVVVRYPDGSVTLNGEPFVAALHFGGHTFAGFLAGLALGAAPLTGAAAGALVRGAGRSAGEVGINDDFVREVEALMKPGTSALFVLDQAGEMAAILEGIQGLGGTVVRTNVDLERARLIQSTLAASEMCKSEDRQ
jgi:uncharacterized membrane protein